MKRERIINLAWPLVVLLAVLLVGGGAWGVGAILFEDPATRKSYPNKTVAGFLGTTSGTVDIQTMPQPTEGEVLTAGCGTSSATSTNTASCARFRPATGGSGLPSGTPGQVPTISAVTATGTVTATATQTSTGTGTVTYTLTSTGTVTTTATEYTAKSLPPDPLGTLYLIEFTNEGELEPMFTRWRAVELWSYITSRSLRQESGECSTGSDALIAAFNPDSIFGLTNAEARTVFPAGDWTAKLRAKVNANGAAIRIEVYLDDGEGPTPWFNWTTDVFSNTDYAVVTKTTTQSEKLVPYGSRIRQIKLYATCSTPTTVTIELNHPAEDSRIETPVLVDSVHYQDIIGMTDALANKANKIIGPEGKTACFYGDNPSNWTTVVTYCDREPVISGTPGQFVKFAGTGTSTTTSKEAGSPGLTTRKFTVKASDFAYGSGAASGNISTQMHVWTLRDGQQDYIYSTVLELPADYVSGLTVSMIWMPSATDNTSTNMVRWKIIAQALTAGASPPYNNRVDTWNGSQCGTGCQEGSVVKETAKALTAFSSGTPYSISVMRDGHSAGDTYVGDVKWIGMEFSYTSSF